jgi:hypothetical protein
MIVNPSVNDIQILSGEEMLAKNMPLGYKDIVQINKS